MNTRPMFLRWPARRPITDNQASELDCTISPLSFPPPGHQPVFQRPARKPVSLATSIAVAAVIGAVVMAVVAPIQTLTIVAAAVGGAR